FLAACAIVVAVVSSQVASGQTPPPSPTPPAPVVPAPAPAVPPPPAQSSPSTNESEFAFSGLSDVTAPTNRDAPSMIADFFIGSGQIVFLGEPNPTAKLRTGVVGTIPSAGGSGRAKISDNNCVFPEDRVFFFYNYYDNAILIPSPTLHALDVNRYTPGFEK